MERIIRTCKRQDQAALDFVERVFTDYKDAQELVPGALERIRGVLDYSFYDALA